MTASAGPEVMRRVQPDSSASLELMRERALETDPALIALCHRRVATLLGEEPQEEWSDEGLTERERAYVAFTEQFVFSVASVSDEDVQALLAYSDPVDVYQFVAALYSLEMSMRIEIASRTVLAEQGGPT